MKFFVVISIIVGLVSIALALPQWGGHPGGLSIYRGVGGNFGGGFRGPNRGFGGGLSPPQPQSFGFGGNAGGSASTSSNPLRAKTFNSGLRGSFDS